MEAEWALTESRALGPTAHLSEVTALSSSPSHSFVMPSMVYSPSPSSLRPQSWLFFKLPMCGVVSMWALTQKRTLGRRRT